MKIINHWILYALLISGVALLTWRWWPNDLRKVEKHMAELLELVSKKGAESLPVGAARSIHAGSFFATNIVMRLGPPFPGSMRRSEAISLLQQGRMQSDRLTLQDRGHEITRLEDGSIQMDMTVNANLTYRGQTDNIIGSYRFIWNNSEDGWKISRADVLNVIEHPAGTSF